MEKTRIRVINSVFNIIYAGKMNKKRTRFLSGKQDVTTDSLIAVAEHAIRFGEPVEITLDGKLRYRITVQEF